MSFMFDTERCICNGFKSKTDMAMILFVRLVSDKVNEKSLKLE